MPLPTEITTAGQQARTAATRAGEMAVGEVTVGDALRKKIAEVYQDSQDIVQPLDVATSEYVSAPAVAREKYQDIFNPFAREKLVSQYTGTQALPMLSLSSILGQRFGRIEDLIGAGTRAYSAQALAAQQAAQQQRLGYTDLLSQYGTEQDLRQQAFENEWAIKQLLGGNITLPSGETIRVPSQVERTLATKTGAGTGAEDVTGLLSQWGLLGDRGVTEPEPQYSPAEGVGATSPQGQWQFTARGWQSTEGEQAGMAQLPPEILLAATPKQRATLTAFFGEQRAREKLEITKQKEQAKRDELQSDAEYKISQIQKAIDYLESKQVDTGPMSGRWLEQVATKTGLSPAATDFYTIVGRIAAEEMFSIGGKVLPAQEIRALRPFIPDTRVAAEKNVSSLKAMKERLQRIYSTEIGKILAEPSQETLEYPSSIVWD